jgi:hypothetical protein
MMACLPSQPGPFNLVGRRHGTGGVGQPPPQDEACAQFGLVCNYPVWAPCSILLTSPSSCSDLVSRSNFLRPMLPDTSLY